MQSSPDSIKSNGDSNVCKFVVKLCPYKKTDEAEEDVKRMPIGKCYRLEEKDHKNPHTGVVTKKLERYVSVFLLDNYAGDTIEKQLKNLLNDVTQNHPFLKKLSSKGVFTVFKCSELEEKLHLTTKTNPEDHVPPDERVIKQGEDFHSHAGIFPQDEQQWLNFDETASKMQKLVEEKTNLGEKVVYSVAEIKEVKV